MITCMDETDFLQILLGTASLVLTAFLAGLNL